MCAGLPSDQPPETSVRPPPGAPTGEATPVQGEQPVVRPLYYSPPGMRASRKWPSTLLYQSTFVNFTQLNKKKMGMYKVHFILHKFKKNCVTSRCTTHWSVAHSVFILTSLYYNCIYIYFQYQIIRACTLI